MSRSTRTRASTAAAARAIASRVQDIFGLSYSVPNDRIIEVVAGIDEEAWLALESGGTLLNFTGERFEVIGGGH